MVKAYYLKNYQYPHSRADLEQVDSLGASVVRDAFTSVKLLKYTTMKRIKAVSTWYR